MELNKEMTLFCRLSLLVGGIGITFSYIFLYPHGVLNISSVLMLVLNLLLIISSLGCSASQSWGKSMLFIVSVIFVVVLCYQVVTNIPMLVVNVIPLIILSGNIYFIIRNKS